MVYELSQIAPFDEKDLRLYQLMETFDWRYLPDPGGLRQQNAALMGRLMTIRLAYQITDDLFDLQEKAEERFNKIQKFAQDADKANAEEERRNNAKR